MEKTAEYVKFKKMEIDLMKISTKPALDLRLSLGALGLYYRICVLLHINDTDVNFKLGDLQKHLDQLIQCNYIKKDGETFEVL